jgi:hypothetical protein
VRLTWGMPSSLFALRMIGSCLGRYIEVMVADSRHLDRRKIWNFFWQILLRHKSSNTLVVYSWFGILNESGLWWHKQALRPSGFGKIFLELYQPPVKNI